MAVPDHEVAIIGAGLGGLGAAIALKTAGIEDFVVLERASDIGGTWRDNTYPGIAVDIPAQAYQFSYELKPDWSRVFATGAEVKAYIDHCADRYDVRRRVRLDSEVLLREWDDGSHLWRLTLPGGSVLTVRFVISALGAFVNPKPAEIARVGDFRGPVLRSAAWDHSVPLDGKRAAIVGTGASAVQIVPEIAPVLDRLDVYQRTPIWVGPKIDFRTSGPAKRVFERHPSVQDAVRRVVTGVVEAGLVGGVVHYESSAWLTRSAAWLARNVWYRQVRDPDVWRRLIPDYDVGYKRPSVSNTYMRTFNRPTVELISERIERVLDRGIRTIDGREREIDVLVLATGFRLATDPENYRLNPVRGRDGFDLASFYASHRARSYESVSMPGLPNPLHDLRPVRMDGRHLARAGRDGLPPRHPRHHRSPPARRDRGRGPLGGSGALDPVRHRAARAFAVEPRLVRDRQQLLLRPPRRHTVFTADQLDPGVAGRADVSAGRLSVSAARRPSARRRVAPSARRLVSGVRNSATPRGGKGGWLARTHEATRSSAARADKDEAGRRQGPLESCRISDPGH